MHTIILYLNFIYWWDEISGVCRTFALLPGKWKYMVCVLHAKSVAHPIWSLELSLSSMFYCHLCSCFFKGFFSRLLLFSWLAVSISLGFLSFSLSVDLVCSLASPMPCLSLSLSLLMSPSLSPSPCFPPLASFFLSRPHFLARPLVQKRSMSHPKSFLPNNFSHFLLLSLLLLQFSYCLRWLLLSYMQWDNSDQNAYHVLMPSTLFYLVRTSPRKANVIKT